MLGIAPDFERWLLKHGLHAHGLDAAQFRDGQRGVVALQTIKPGTSSVGSQKCHMSRNWTLHACCSEPLQEKRPIGHTHAGSVLLEVPGKLLLSTASARRCPRLAPVLAACPSQSPVQVQVCTNITSCLILHPKLNDEDCL